MIVEKAYNMAKMMNIPVLGLVQNMSYLVCPDCGKKIYIYGEGHGDEMASSLHIPAYASLPIEPEVAALCDSGDIERFDTEYLDEFIRVLTLKA